MIKKITFAQGWKFVGVAYFKYDEAEVKTKSDFILGPKSSFSDFFKKHLKSSSGPADVSYKVIFHN